MPDVRPYPKAAQLANSPAGIGMPKHGGQRRFRVKASKAEWEQIVAAKQGPCRVCDETRVAPGHPHAILTVSYHHLLFRAHGGGDIRDNIVPLHNVCHDLVHQRDPEACRALLTSLTDGEYAYLVTVGGEDVFERVYGLEYQRP